MCYNDLQFSVKQTHSTTLNNIEEQQHQSPVQGGETSFVQTTVMGWRLPHTLSLALTETEVFKRRAIGNEKGV